MAQPASTFDSYDAIGNREDLSDVIYNISPTLTPFMSGIKKTTATATNHEWQTDELSAVDGSNAVIEGDDATTTASAPTVRLGNQTQISDKVPRVTGTQRKNSSAGRGDEMDYQVTKSSRELKRDIETILLSNQAKVVGNSTTARKLAAVESWLGTNTSAGTGGADPTGDGTDARTDGTQRALLESDVKSVLADIANEGGNAGHIMVGSFNKQAFSAFSGNATRTTDSTNQALNTAVHIYVSDFGELSVTFNRFQRKRSCLILDMEMWGFATLRDFQSTDLAKTGDTDRKQILCEYTLECNQEKASGIVADLTTA
tara:strand:+ start:121 stop:1065 length:945 start_codon:yes stop_codon:yes gene_type:complete